MSDLPHAQPIYNDGGVSNNNGTPVNPGSSLGEKAPGETILSISSETEKSEESLRSPEKIPTPKPQTKPKEKTQPLNQTEPSQQKSDKVVDKTDEITTLHKIEETKDKLTKEADDEEEHFIKEVEKHHGNL